MNNEYNKKYYNNNKYSGNYKTYPSPQNYYSNQINKHNPQKYTQTNSNKEIPYATQDGFPMDLMMDDIPTTTSITKEEYDVDSSNIFQHNIGYKLAIQNAITIYNKAKYIQDTSRNTLISSELLQVVRSANSVCANLAEANNSKTNKMLLQKLYVAFGELNETLAHLEILYSTNHITSEEHQELYNQYIHIIRIIRKSINTIKGKEEQ